MAGFYFETRKPGHFFGSGHVAIEFSIPFYFEVANLCTSILRLKLVGKIRPELVQTRMSVLGNQSVLGFFRNKAKNLVLGARRIVQDFKGQIPKDRTLLESIPGVGPKSAAVIIANAFGVPAIAVDTHVGRVARRLGLTKNQDPSKVEADLTKLFPKERLLEAHHVLIFHGRRICHARKPNCAQCPVRIECPKAGVLKS